MANNNIGVYVTGAGELGGPSPGAAKMSRQVIAASSTSNCGTTRTAATTSAATTTGCSVVTRRCDQEATTGKTKTTNMEGTTNQVKLKGPGELEGSRPGSEGIVKRVPSASSSNDRGCEQVENQACSNSIATGNDEDMLISSSDESYDSFPPHEWAAKRKGKKRGRLESAEDSSSAREKGKNRNRRRKDVDVDDIEAYILDTTQKAPAPSKGSKRLPTDVERLAEADTMPTANLSASILEDMEKVERIAHACANLKGTVKRELRDVAGGTRARTTAMAKRTTVSGTNVAMEQEIIRLQARVQLLEELLAKANMAVPALQELHSSSRNELLAICPAPPEPVVRTVTTRSTPQEVAPPSEMQELKEMVKSLARDVATLREEKRKGKPASASDRIEVIRAEVRASAHKSATKPM